MSKCKSAQKMAEIIAEIYEEKFEGKKRGRFQISRSQFRKLGGRKNLCDAFIDEVAEECLKRGYIMISIRDAIAIIDENVLLNYRTVPMSILHSYIDEGDDEDDVPSLEDDDE